MKGVLNSVIAVIDKIGAGMIDVISQVGAMTFFMGRAMIGLFKRPYRFRLIAEQAEFVGFGSLFIIILTGTFTGMVFCLQTITALSRVGMETLVGSSVMLAVSRELGPVLTSLMVTGRVGSAMATELGTMRVSEQIDAMDVIAVDPVKYLISPRIAAGTIMVPCLTVIFDLVAFMGAYIIAIPYFGIDEGAYMSRIEWYLDPYDYWQGLIKSVVFGLVLTTVGCYKGFYASGGARGVGVATTQAVVIGSIATFVLDYVLTTVILLVFPE